MHSTTGPPARAGRTRPAGLGTRLTVTVLAALLTACSSGDDATASADATTATTSSTSTTTSTTTTTLPPSTALDNSQSPPAELSFGEYQQVLVEADTAVHTTLETLAAAGSHSALQAQAAQSAGTISAAAERLADITPPDSLSGQHEALVQGLEGLALGVADTATQVEQRALCATPAVLSALDALPATGEIRSATHALHAAGAGVVTFLPRLAQPPVQRPANGAHLRPQETDGAGVLTIENHGIGRDAVVSVLRGNTVVLSFYVRGNSQHTVEGIGDGGYTVYYSHGREWSQQRRAFGRDCDFEKFDDPVRFETTVTETPTVITTHYDEWTLGLRATPTGNATTSEIPPDEFPT